MMGHCDILQKQLLEKRELAKNTKPQQRYKK
jgi:hypothetical protein